MASSPKPLTETADAPRPTGANSPIPPITRSQDPFRWEGVDVHPYKETGDHFRSISRQTLFPGAYDLPVELRYFEIQDGGHSTLERHQHAHLVMVVQGHGQVLLRDAVAEFGPQDVVHIGPMTWHQFRANRGETVGFLCVVNQDRDRPQRPTDDDLTMLRTSPAVEEFIRA